MFLIGQSQDQHQLSKNQPLIIGGICLSKQWGSKAHSDGDVLIHAISEAILGAIQEGDLGDHFSDCDQKWANAPSTLFLKRALQLLAAKKYQLVNIDTLIIVDEIMITPFKPAILANLQKITNCSRINIKATRNEGSDIMKTTKKICAQAIVLITKKEV